MVFGGWMPRPMASGSPWVGLFWFLRTTTCSPSCLELRSSLGKRRRRSHRSGFNSQVCHSHSVARSPLVRCTGKRPVQAGMHLFATCCVLVILHALCSARMLNGSKTKCCLLGQTRRNLSHIVVTEIQNCVASMV